MNLLQVLAEVHSERGKKCLALGTLSDSLFIVYLFLTSEIKLVAL